MIGRLGRWAERHPCQAGAAVLTVIACAWLAGVLRGHLLGQSYILVSDPPFEIAGAPAGTLPARTVFPDAGLAFHPWQVVAREQLSDGELPLWNPYEYGGTPLLANMQSALLFPLTWLALLISPDVAAGIVGIAKLVLAGLGAFVLARALGVRPWGAALLAGTVYMLAAPMVVWLQWPHGGTFGLYPWLLLASHRLAERPGGRPVAATALAVTLTILAGHPESALAAVSAAGVYLLALRPGWPAVGRWLAAGALGVAGAAAVVLPFARALESSVTQATHTIGTGDLPLYSALHYLAPDLFGDAQPGIYGFPFYTSIAGYFGVPALMLALVALWRCRARRATVALAITALVALMVTYGIPPVSWFTSNVAPWSSSLLSGRVYFVVALPAAIGAGAGFAALCERRLRIRDAALLAGAVAAALALGLGLAEARDLVQSPSTVVRDALLVAAATIAAGGLMVAGVGRLRGHVMVPVAIAVAALSVVQLRGLNVTLAAHDAYPPTPPALRFLQQQDWPFRVQVVRPRDTMVPPNVLAEHGLESLEGYDFPLSERWSDLQGAALRYSGLLPERRVLIGPPQPAALPAFRLFGVRYYLAEPGAQAPAPGLERVYDEPDGTVFRDPDALPRAFVVPSTRELPGDRALAVLGSGGFDPREVALVEPGAARAPPGGGFAAARVERVGADHLRVHLPDGAAGWLVIANAWSDAWSATVDGRSVDLEPTDYAAMGLPVSAGDRVVDVELDRSIYLVGALISLLALAAMAALALRGTGAGGRAPPQRAGPGTAPPSA